MKILEAMPLLPYLVDKSTLPQLLHNIDKNIQSYFTPPICDYLTIEVLSHLLDEGCVDTPWCIYKICFGESTRYVTSYLQDTLRHVS